MFFWSQIAMILSLRANSWANKNREKSPVVMKIASLYNKGPKWKTDLSSMQTMDNYFFVWYFDKRHSEYYEWYYKVYMVHTVSMIETI